MPFTPRTNHKGVTLLISSAGRRVELLNCFRDDASRLGLPLRIICGDLNPCMSAACQVADLSIQFPRATSNEFPGFLEEICDRERVNLVVPTIDTELLAMAHAAPELRSGGVTVAVSTPSVINLARDKAFTARALSTAGISTPATLPLHSLEEALDRWGFPLIAKPVDGSNSSGLRRLSTPRDLEGLPEDRSGHIVQQWIRGREFTVNFLMDRDSKIVSAIPHERLEVRGGEVSKGRTTLLPHLEKLLPKLESVLTGGFGPLCFQCILAPDGDLVVFEINARFGGGYPLTHRSGGRFSRWLLETAVGRTPLPLTEWTRNLTMLRYDAAVFVDGSV